MHAHTHRPYTPVKLSAATGTFHLGRLYLAALLPRSVRPYLSHSSSLSSPLLSCPSRLSSSLVGSFLFSLPDDLLPFVIKSFGRHKICAIYHISLARKKCINSSIAFVKGEGGEALSHRIIAQGFVPSVSCYRTNLPSSGCGSSEGK